MDRVSVSNFRVVTKNTLRGFFTLVYGQMEVNDCALHQKNARPWFAFPGRKIEKADGTSTWTNVVYVSDRAHLDKLQKHVCGLLTEHLDSESSSADAKSESSTEDIPF